MCKVFASHRKISLHIRTHLFNVEHIIYSINHRVLFLVIKQDAGEIFAKYLGKDAVCAVGITDSIRDSTIQRICCSDGSIDVDCFADAQRFVYNILDNRY
jgi:hypothetical protein